MDSGMCFKVCLRFSACLFSPDIEFAATCGTMFWTKFVNLSFEFSGNREKTDLQFIWAGVKNIVVRVGSMM